MAEQTKEYSKEQLFRPFDLIRKNAPPVEPLWGFFVFKKAVTSIIGDPGICKTTFGYRLATRLCLGQPFLDIHPEEPIMSLILDWESSDSLIASRGNLVCQAEELVPNLYIYNATELYITHITGQLKEFCGEKHINLVLIDNQRYAFPTKDENDNAEAIRQTRYLKELAIAMDVAIVIYHHSSKADLPGTRKGSGAFARAGAADVTINLDRVEGHEDIVAFEVTKNRLVDERPYWYLKKKQGEFHICEAPVGAEFASRGETITYHVQRAILELLNNGNKFKRHDIIQTLTADYNSRTIQDSIDRLVQMGRLIKPQYGYYELRKFT